MSSFAGKYQPGFTVPSEDEIASVRELRRSLEEEIEKLRNLPHSTPLKAFDDDNEEEEGEDEESDEEEKIKDGDKLGENGIGGNSDSKIISDDSTPKFQSSSSSSSSLTSFFSSASESESLSYKFTDTTILRFLRGRQGDKDKALKAMLRHLKWRSEFKVDSIDPSTIQSEIDKRKIFCESFDKCGRPVVTILARNHDKQDRDFETMQRFIIYQLEVALKMTRPEEEKILILFDLSEFSMQCMDYDVVKFLVQTLTFNYPETLSVALITNAPFIFSACWLVIKPWLDPVTAAKCTFLKREELSDYIEEHFIPPEVMGT